MKYQVKDRLKARSNDYFTITEVDPNNSEQGRGIMDESKNPQPWISGALDLGWKLVKRNSRTICDGCGK